jgi:hypothetical protein
MDSGSVKWPAIRQFWASREGVDKEPRRPITRTGPAPPKQQQPKLRRKPKQLDLRPAVGPVEILGVVKEDNLLKIAVRFPPDKKVSMVPSLEARIRFPRQLTEYYERHIHFL